MRGRRWLRGVLIASVAVLTLVPLGRLAIGALFAAALGPGPMARCDGHRTFQPAL